MRTWRVLRNFVISAPILINRFAVFLIRIRLFSTIDKMLFSQLYLAIYGITGWKVSFADRRWMCYMRVTSDVCQRRRFTCDLACRMSGGLHVVYMQVMWDLIAVFCENACHLQVRLPALHMSFYLLIEWKIASHIQNFLLEYFVHCTWNTQQNYLHISKILPAVEFETTCVSQVKLPAKFV